LFSAIYHITYYGARENNVILSGIYQILIACLYNILPADQHPGEMPEENGDRKVIVLMAQLLNECKNKGM
jgi:hypothetical protein